MRMGSSKSQVSSVAEFDAVSAVRRRAVGLMTGALAAAVAFGAVALTTPANSQSAAAPTQVNLNQGSEYTALQAQELSKSPRPQIVLHYDATMFDDPVKNTVYISSVISMAKVLRNNGYHAIAVPGGPERGVRVFIAGLTSDKLVYNIQQIEDGDPMNYAAGYYKKIIGQPESKSVDVASLNLERF